MDSVVLKLFVKRSRVFEGEEFEDELFVLGVEGMIYGVVVEYERCRYFLRC